MKKLLLLSIIALISYSCLPKINYLKVYEDLMVDLNRLQEMKICSDYFYSEKIEKLDYIIAKTDQLLLKERAKKTRDSLIEINKYFIKYDVTSYCFPNIKSFNEFKKADSILDSKNLSFCKIANEYKTYNDMAWVIAKETYPEDYNKQGYFWEEEYNNKIIEFNKVNNIGSFEKVILDFYGSDICN